MSGQGQYGEVLAVKQKQLRARQAEREEKLSRRQRDGILALLANPSIKGASQASGIPESTFRRWMCNPLFMNEWRQRSDAQYAHSIKFLKANSHLAAGTLVQLSVKAESQGDRISASDKVLRAISQADTSELAEKIRQLEESRSNYGHSSGFGVDTLEAEQILLELEAPAIEITAEAVEPEADNTEP